MDAVWLAVLGWALAAATITPELVQLRRSRNLGAHPGLSATTVSVTLVVFAWWVSYSAKLAVWPAVVTDAVAFLVAAAHARVTRVLTRGRLLAVGSLVVLGAVGPSGIVGAAATAGSACRGIPQLRAAWRSSTTDGISPEYWALQAVSSLGWLVYGIAAGAPWLGAFAVVAFPVSCAIAWRTGVPRREAVGAGLSTV